VAQRFKPAPPHPELDELLKAAAAKMAAMPVRDYLSMLALQRLSLNLSEAVMSVHEAGPDNRHRRAMGALFLTVAYEQALDGQPHRDIDLATAGYIALLTDADRAWLRNSISEKRSILDSTPAPV
jgi:hypothetical protein